MNVKEAIAKMDTDGVVNELRRLGIKGFSGVPDKCPVARYLQKTVTSIVWVSVSQDGVYFSDLSAPGLIRATVDIPLSVKNFITDFDQNKYPEFLDDN